MVGLGEAAGRRAGGYSLGMGQRLGIAGAMLGDPGVVVMDEPFNGMDPEGIVWLKGFLRRLAAEGRAVLISSHLMGELQDTARHVVVVGRGKVVADTTVEELIASASEGHVTLRTTRPKDAAAVLTRAGAEVTSTAPDSPNTPDSAPDTGTLGTRDSAPGTPESTTDTPVTLTITGRGGTSRPPGWGGGTSRPPGWGRVRPEDVVALLTAHAIPFSEVSAHRATLEQAYMRLTREATEFKGTPR